VAAGQAGLQIMGDEHAQLGPMRFAVLIASRWKGLTQRGAMGGPHRRSIDEKCARAQGGKGAVQVGG